MHMAATYIVSIFFASVFYKAVLLMHVSHSVLGKINIHCKVRACQNLACRFLQQ